MAMAKRQLQISGTERVVIAEVEDAANAYREARDARMAATKLEAERHEMLVSAMNSHDVREYTYDDDEGKELIVKLNTKTKVTVRRPKPEIEVLDGGDES